MKDVRVVKVDLMSCSSFSSAKRVESEAGIAMHQALTYYALQFLCFSSGVSSYAFFPLFAKRL
jgi:hypothetical protein